MVSPRARGGRSSAAACSGTYHANVIVDVVDLPVGCGDQHLGRQQLLHSEHDAVLAPHAHTRAGTPTQPTHTCALVVARLWLCGCDAAPRLPLRRTHFAQWPSERTRPGTHGHRASTSRTNHRTAQRNATENSGEEQRGHKHTHSAGSKAIGKWNASWHWVQHRQAASHAHTATYACTCAAHTDRREAEGSTLPVWRGFLCTAVGSNGTQLCFHRPNRFFDDAIITPPPHGEPTPPDSDAPSASSLALALAIASRFFRVISGAFFVAVRGAAALAFSR